MNRKLESLICYFRHRARSQSKYKIHSPFVFDLYTNVIARSEQHLQYRVINRLRKELVLVLRYIKRRDLGAINRDFPADQRFVRVRDIAVHDSINKKSGELLFRFGELFRPATILELGTSLGISTIYLSLAAPESQIITIEGCIDSAHLAEDNFEKTGLKNIKVIIGRFEEKLAEALTRMPSPDLIFIDGNPAKEPTLAYFRQCLQHINSRTVIIINNICRSTEMRKAWKSICAEPKVKVTLDLGRMGVVFFREELSKEDFILNF